MGSWEQITYNIVGGIIVAGLTFPYRWITALLRSYRFQRIFGPIQENQFFLVYGLLELGKCLDERGNSVEAPYIKPGVGGAFRISSLVSAAQTRGIKYIAEMFGKNVRVTPFLVPDNEIRDRMDISYCSIGGKDNLKTNDALEDDENKFFDFDTTTNPVTIRVKETGERFCCRNNHDYAFIIKLRPKSLQDRTWVAIAGLGEWGTSGAAWYLAKNWKAIGSRYKRKSFGLIIRVKAGKDESAELIFQSKK